MNKQLIICGAIILLLAIGFCGCLDDSNKDEENDENSETDIFIGKWKTTIYYYDINGTRYDEQPSNSTFFTNGTMGSESAYDDEMIWTPYVIQGNQICLGEANQLDYYCYYYEFLDNGTKARLVTYTQDPDSGEEYKIVIEMSKN